MEMKKQFQRSHVWQWESISLLLLLLLEAGDFIGQANKLKTEKKITENSRTNERKTKQNKKLMLTAEQGKLNTLLEM